MSEKIDIFGEFAPAYTISNKELRWATRAIPNASKVLTVAGAGDQALFYKLAGAKQIHTFDKTNNARVIQDIKTTAIKRCSPLRYYNLLLDLFHSKDITKIHLMQKIMPLLPAETINIIQKPGNNHIFGAGLDVRYYPENVPTEQEYAKLRNTLEKPFRFIASDLADLSTKIYGKYDLINISNIFDYCYNANTKVKILHDLTMHLNIGGHIVYLPQNIGGWYPNFYLESKNYRLDYTKTLTHNNSKMILFQRTR